jgi:hypothetical protein
MNQSLAILIALMTPTVIAASASAQIAGSPKSNVAAAGGKTTHAAPKAAVVSNVAATPATAASASAADSNPSLAAPQSQAPGGGQSVSTMLVSVTPQSSTPVTPVAACLPECRSGYVCREGECVSGCNPGCGENETCNAKRECVPKTAESEGFPYDKTRFGIGGALGMSATPDGNGTPFGGLISVSVPLGGHWYSREDVIVTYSETATNDHQYFGSAPTAGTTPVDQQYLLVALRATAGYQFNSLISARAGFFAGSHTLTTQHGFCGAGPQERDTSSAALGGTGGIGFALKHADLSAVADVYSAETQQTCSVIPTTPGFFNQAQLVPQRQVAAQFLAQLTFMF